MLIAHSNRSGSTIVPLCVLMVTVFAGCNRQAPVQGLSYAERASNAAEWFRLKIAEAKKRNGKHVVEYLIPTFERGMAIVEAARIREPAVFGSCMYRNGDFLLLDLLWLEDIEAGVASGVRLTSADGTAYSYPEAISWQARDPSANKLTLVRDYQFVVIEGDSPGVDTNAQWPTIIVPKAGLRPGLKVSLLRDSGEATAPLSVQMTGLTESNEPKLEQ